MLRAVSIWPPEEWILEVQFRNLRGQERDGLGGIGRYGDGTLEGDDRACVIAPYRGGKMTLLLAGGMIEKRGRDREPRPVAGRKREIRRDGRVLDGDRSGSGQGDPAPDAGFRSRMPGIQSQPMEQRNVGPSIAEMPPLWPIPFLMVCSLGVPGWGCGVMRTASVARAPGVTQEVISKRPRMKAPFI